VLIRRYWRGWELGCICGEEWRWQQTGIEVYAVGGLGYRRMGYVVDIVLVAFYRILNLFVKIHEETSFALYGIWEGWQHAKYAYGVWESFAHQADTILRTFKNHPTSKSENMFFQMFGFGTQRVEQIYLISQNAA
jgi:hypothetical protein